MNLLAIDFETQCDQTQTTRITEVGCAWKTWGNYMPNESSLAPAPGKYSEFCYEPDYPPQTAFIEELTGISDEMLRKEGRSRRLVFEGMLLPLVHRADIIFAHKKAFDQTVFESTCKLLGLEVPKKEWICTLSEVKWPKKYTCHKLGHLAFEYGLFDEGKFDRKMLHRAGDDSEVLLHLMTEEHNLHDVLKFAREPWVYLKAYCIEPWKDGGEQTGIAKKLGFGWESCRHDNEHKWPKTWVKRMKQSEYPEFCKLADGVPFRISQIEGLN
jgi:DNA polymerase III epsilon subunit-like protein